MSSELNYSFALLTIGCNTVAIFKISDGSFKIFYSHARDLFGVPNAFGKCVFIAVTDMQSLNIYFQTVSPRGVIAFELKGVRICPHGQKIPTPDCNESISQIKTHSEILCNKSSFVNEKVPSKTKKDTLIFNSIHFLENFC